MEERRVVKLGQFWTRSEGVAPRRVAAFKDKNGEKQAILVKKDGSKCGIIYLRDDGTPVHYWTLVRDVSVDDRPEVKLGQMWSNGGSVFYMVNDIDDVTMYATLTRTLGVSDGECRLGYQTLMSLEKNSDSKLVSKLNGWELGQDYPVRDYSWMPKIVDPPHHTHHVSLGQVWKFPLTPDMTVNKIIWPENSGGYALLKLTDPPTKHRNLEWKMPLKDDGTPINDQWILVSGQPAEWGSVPKPTEKPAHRIGRKPVARVGQKWIHVDGTAVWISRIAGPGQAEIIDSHEKRIVGTYMHLLANGVPGPPWQFVAGPEPKSEPDATCVTTEDGGCIAEDCMHTREAPEVKQAETIAAKIAALPNRCVDAAEKKGPQIGQMWRYNEGQNCIIRSINTDKNNGEKVAFLLTLSGSTMSMRFNDAGPLDPF
ncbi:MAG TPA: hypothetical protein VF905_01690, partial [Nitrospirota bacterium]